MIPYKKEEEDSYSIAIENYDCPICGAVKGYHCLTAKGRKKWPPHGPRLKLVEDNRKE